MVVAGTLETQMAQLLPRTYRWGKLSFKKPAKSYDLTGFHMAPESGLEPETR